MQEVAVAETVVLELLELEAQAAEAQEETEAVLVVLMEQMA
jgi:hypothetical protein